MERQDKVHLGATNFLPLIYELNWETAYNLQEGEEAMRMAMRIASLRGKGAGGRKHARESLTKHINDVQAELVGVRDRRTTSGKEIVAQCQQEIEKGGASAAVYQAVFQSIEGPESEGMLKYQDAAEALQDQLRQAAPRCEQNTADLAELYEQAVSIGDEAFKIMNGLRKPSESASCPQVKDSDGSRRRSMIGLRLAPVPNCEAAYEAASEAAAVTVQAAARGAAVRRKRAGERSLTVDSWRLERGPLKKLRYATRPNTNSPTLLTTVSCVWPQPCK